MKAIKQHLCFHPKGHLEFEILNKVNKLLSKYKMEIVIVGIDKKNNYLFAIKDIK